MKKLLPQIVLLLFVFSDAKSQTGMWTWVSGDSVPNSPGVFGVQGVPSPLNHPPALYEPCEWTDLQGNFWLFGGFKNGGFGNFYGDLWKFDPSSNEWTWVKGIGQPNFLGVYGIKGVPSSSNLPSCRSFGATTWVDGNGDLWLYGGRPTMGSGLLCDLWKFNIASNMWTWVNGSSVLQQSPVYGTLGVADSNNTPGSRDECNAAWVDSYNNLWLFGGFNVGSFNDLWKYDPVINQWTWVKGPNVQNSLGSYGIKGVPSFSNIPGSRWTYNHWKDSLGNFWFFGGTHSYTGAYNDMWRYNPAANEWTWMSGTNFIDNNGHYGIPCVSLNSNLPPARYEDRVFWTDNKGNFWLYGGGRDTWLNPQYGDLWMFSYQSNYWTFVSGDTLTNQVPIYGNKNIPSILNKPGSRSGAIGWFCSNNNSLFLFGGTVSYYPSCGNDLWKYEIDSTCPLVSVVPPVINLSTSDTTFCEKNCINFFDLSINNPTSWQWHFPGASPDTSTLQNPTGICYNTYGNYDVTLIACNGNGCDSLHLTNFITCFQNPVDSIYQSNDTLYSLPAFSYQWYEITSGIINGATNQYYVLSQPGSYFCVVTDSIGCIANSNTITITALNQLSIDNYPLLIIPNPNDGSFEIVLNNEQGTRNAEVRILNAIGQVVFYSLLTTDYLQNTTDRSLIKTHLPNGIYSISVTTNNGIISKRIEVIH